jgi:putative oxidoreductase
MSIRTLNVIYQQITGYLDHTADEVLPLLARFTFAATLSVFFWKSVLTKFGDGLTGLVVPSAGAYLQIFPMRFEAVGYDTDALSSLDWLVAVAGTYGELILPILVVIGLATRFAAFGMMGFIVVMSIVDVWGHNVMAGQLFDGDPSSLVADQRLYWLLMLAVLVFRGGGSLSVDKVLSRMMVNRT